MTVPDAIQPNVHSGEIAPPPVVAAPAAPTAVHGLAAILGDPVAPRWLREFHRFLPVKSQMVLTGAVRDRVAFPLGEGAYDMRSVSETLVDTLALRGITHTIIVDPVHGFTIGVPTEGGEADAQATIAWCNTLCNASEKMHFEQDSLGRFSAPGSLTWAVEFAERAIHKTGTRCAFIFDYLMGGGDRGGKEGAPFIRSLIASHDARARGGMYNPIVWIVDRENDLPAWFTLGNPRIRSISIAKPDRLVRSVVAGSLLAGIGGFAELETAQRETAVADFSQQTDGMSLGDLEAIASLCRAEALRPLEIGEATRRYKLGVTEDVWQRMGEHTLEDAERVIRERVRGQQAAIAKALDIVRRSIVGLSGAQAARNSGRPRGVLFFAGPTGVGKTELAKALTEALFGDEQAYIRFDMSEFNHEHADQRLVGAPPGYVGYDAGGELTSAIREKPCSIVLFDEIEKANGKILDKFLQILDDGQLTSGAGERVWFSDALIIFTSNIGMAGATSDMEYPSLEKRIRTGVQQFFTSELNRPELLNRIGDNIVVFDYIRPDIAASIFEKMFKNILLRVAEVRNIIVDAEPAAINDIRARCTADLAHGGRGIGNMLESSLINPLSHALLEAGVRRNDKVRIEKFRIDNGAPRIDLRIL